MPFLLRATPRLDLAGWTLRSEVNHDGDRAFGRHTRPDPERYEYRNVLASHPPSGQYALAMDEVETMLYATTETISTEALRQFYKGWDNGEVADVAERAPRLRLGTTYVIEPETENLRGPVGRVDDLLGRLGSPDHLPVLDHDVREALVSAFALVESDPAFDVAPIASLADFLDRHHGSGLFTIALPAD